MSARRQFVIMKPFIFTDPDDKPPQYASVEEALEFLFYLGYFSLLLVYWLRM